VAVGPWRYRAVRVERNRILDVHEVVGRTEGLSARLEHREQRVHIWVRMGLARIEQGRPAEGLHMLDRPSSSLHRVGWISMRVLPSHGQLPRLKISVFPG
jgi:hypothetical protein